MIRKIVMNQTHSYSPKDEEEKSRLDIWLNLWTVDDAPNDSSMVAGGRHGNGNHNVPTNGGFATLMILWSLLLLMTTTEMTSAGGGSWETTKVWDSRLKERPNSLNFQFSTWKQQYLGIEKWTQVLAKRGKDNDNTRGLGGKLSSTDDNDKDTRDDKDKYNTTENMTNTIGRAGRRGCRNICRWDRGYTDPPDGAD